MEPDAPVPPANSPSSATVEGTDADDPVLPLLPPRLELLSMADFDDCDLVAMNGALKGNTRYRFAFAEGGYRTYNGCRPKKGRRTPADDRTSMFDIETASWVPIPADKTSPHTPEDLIEAVNDVRIMDRRCIAYVHPEARKAFKALNASRQPNDPEIHPLHVYNLSKEDEAALVAGLDGSEAVYKFQKTWEEGYIRYEASLPREGVPNAADLRTEMWDDQTQKYRMLAAGYTVPHDPQDYVDAVNWEIARAEKHRRAAISCAGRKLRSRNKEEKQEIAEQVNKQNGAGDWEDWDAPDPLIESDLSGSDYEEARRGLEKTRAWHKSRGRSVTDTEEDDAKIDEEDAEEEPDLEHDKEEEVCSKAKGRSVTDAEEEDTRFDEEEDEEERDLERDEQEEARSKAARVVLSTMKREGKAPTSTDAHWEDLRASFSPSQLDAASVLNSYGLTLMPNALLPDLEELSSTKPSLMEMALYPMFGQIVWQVAHKLGHLYGRSSEFAMEKAGLLRKEKRAPNRYNTFKTFVSRTKPEEGDHG
jgi:hypothetical protein